MSRAEQTDSEAAPTCAVEGCEPSVSGCGLLRIAPQTPLWQTYEMGCAKTRWLVDVFPYEDRA